MRGVPLLLLAVMAAPAAAQPADDAAALRGAVQAFETARVAGDRPALERLLAPGFLFVRASGRIGDRRDYVAGFTDPGNRLAGFDVSDRLFLRATPDVAIVGGEVLARGREGASPLGRRFRFSDDWVRRDGRWLVIFEQITPLP